MNKNDKEPKYEFEYMGTDPNNEFTTSKDIIDHYVKLNDNGEVQKGYDFIKQFRLIGTPSEIEKFNNAVEQVRYNHLIDEQVYKNTDEDYLPAIDFTNSISKGTYDKLENNKFKNEFDDVKNLLGRNANRLRIVFEPEKQKLLGLDWLRSDNTDANIDVFYKNSKLDPTILENNDVVIRKKGGKTYLEFDKDNELANQILLNVPHSSAYTPKVYGMFDNSNDIKNSKDYIRESYNGKNYFIIEDGSPQIYLDNIFMTPMAAGAYSYYSQPNIVKLQTIYDEADEITKKAYDELSSVEKTYSTHIIPNYFGALSDLDNNNLKTNDLKYKKLEKIRSLITGIALADFSKYEIYASSEENPNGSERITDPEIFTDIKNRFSKETSSNISNIVYGVAISGSGKIGLKLSLPAKVDNKGDIIYDALQFTVYGNDIEQDLQLMTNNDPKLRAWKEAKFMQELGHPHISVTGDVYRYIGDNKWMINEDEITDINNIVKQIHQDALIKNLSYDIAKESISINGKILDENKIELYKRSAAIEILSEVYDASFSDLNKNINGIQTNTLDNIFKFKGIGNVVAEDYKDYFTEPMYNIYNDLYKIYGIINDKVNEYIIN